MRRSLSDISVTTFRKGSGWYVNVFFPKTGWRRKRSLAVQDDAAVPAALEIFRKTDLPALVAEHDRLHTTISPDSDPTIRSIIDHYCEVFLPNKGAAETTLTKASQVCYDFQRFCAGRNIGRISQLTPAAVDAWSAALRENGLAPKTITSYLILLRAALNAAVNREIIAQNPIRRWLMPKSPDPEINPLTAAQLARVLEIIDVQEPFYANVVRWMALTGNRPSDAVALRWSQVDIERRFVVRAQVKTKRLAKYEISSGAADVLVAERARDCYDPADRVFLDEYGRVLTINRVYRQFTRALIRAGFDRPVNLKDLRHTFGTILANAEPPCPLPVLQVLMGHRNVLTTMQYVRSGSADRYIDNLAAALSNPSRPSPPSPTSHSSHPSSPSPPSHPSTNPPKTKAPAHVTRAPKTTERLPKKQ